MALCKLFDSIRSKLFQTLFSLLYIWLQELNILCQNLFSWQKTLNSHFMSYIWLFQTKKMNDSASIHFYRNVQYFFILIFQNNLYSTSIVILLLRTMLLNTISLKFNKCCLIIFLVNSFDATISFILIVSFLAFLISRILFSFLASLPFYKKFKNINCNLLHLVFFIILFPH